MTSGFRKVMRFGIRDREVPPWSHMVNRPYVILNGNTSDVAFVNPVMLNGITKRIAQSRIKHALELGVVSKPFQLELYVTYENAMD